MSAITVQPHPVVASLIQALDVCPGHADEFIVDINALIAGTHTYCWVHHEVEAARAGRCFECGHGWDTDAQLVDEDFETSLALYPNQAVRAYTVDMVFVCPACSHDL